MNRGDLQQLAETRLAEAKSLLAAGHPSGAYYLAGYAVECALKTRIASFTQQYDFPDKRKAFEYYTHSIKDLVKAAKLHSELNSKQIADPAFDAAWVATANWSEESRYGTSSQEHAEELVKAIEDSDHGVLTWLKNYW